MHPDAPGQPAVQVFVPCQDRQGRKLPVVRPMPFHLRPRASASFQTRRAVLSAVQAQGGPCGAGGARTCSSFQSLACRAKDGPTPSPLVCLGRWSFPQSCWYSAPANTRPVSLHFRCGSSAALQGSGSPIPQLSMDGGALRRPHCLHFSYLWNLRMSWK